ILRLDTFYSSEGMGSAISITPNRRVDSAGGVAPASVASKIFGSGSSDNEQHEEDSGRPRHGGRPSGGPEPVHLSIRQVGVDPPRVRGLGGGAWLPLHRDAGDRGDRAVQAHERRDVR